MFVRKKIRVWNFRLLNYMSKFNVLEFIYDIFYLEYFMLVNYYDKIWDI